MKFNSLLMGMVTTEKDTQVFMEGLRAEIRLLILMFIVVLVIIFEHA